MSVVGKSGVVGVVGMAGALGVLGRGADSAGVVAPCDGVCAEGGWGEWVELGVVARCTGSGAAVRGRGAPGVGLVGSAGELGMARCTGGGVGPVGRGVVGAGFGVEPVGAVGVVARWTGGAGGIGGAGGAGDVGGAGGAGGVAGLCDETGGTGELGATARWTGGAAGPVGPDAAGACCGASVRGAGFDGGVDAGDPAARCTAGGVGAVAPFGVAAGEVGAEDGAVEGELGDVLR
ncbi:hypothetical protein [Streptomyces sp. NPDC059009]|uniref:hypothetical protein n=1 Tax=Streptomyces sp. NPDC059009 TaxID=3346694 RepID=UPI0036A85043